MENETAPRPSFAPATCFTANPTAAPRTSSPAAEQRETTGPTLYTPTFIELSDLMIEIDTLYADCRAAAESLKATLDGPADALLSLEHIYQCDDEYKEVNKAVCDLSSKLCDIDLNARNFYSLMRRYAIRRHAYDKPQA